MTASRHGLELTANAEQKHHSHAAKQKHRSHAALLAMVERLLRERGIAGASAADLPMAPDPAPQWIPAV